jgi:hypothetical protein
VTDDHRFVGFRKHTIVENVRKAALMMGWTLAGLGFGMGYATGRIMNSRIDRLITVAETISFNAVVAMVVGAVLIVAAVTHVLMSNYA